MHSVPGTVTTAELIFSYLICTFDPWVLEKMGIAVPHLPSLLTAFTPSEGCPALLCTLPVILCYSFSTWQLTAGPRDTFNDTHWGERSNFTPDGCFYILVLPLHHCTSVMGLETPQRD